jgi:hypothetical protein
MKLALLATAGLLAFASPVLAQEAPPPAASASAQQPVDPERLALAREMIEVLDLQATLKGMYGSMLTTIKRPEGLTPDQQARFDQLVASMGVGLNATIPDMTDLIVGIYARNLTAQEMRDSLAFYRSASGQAMLKKVPALTKEAMGLTVQLMPRVWTAAKADYCKHRTCDKLDEQMFDRMGAIYGVPAKAAN